MTSLCSHELEARVRLIIRKIDTVLNRANGMSFGTRQRTYTRLPSCVRHQQRVHMIATSSSCTLALFHFVSRNIIEVDELALVRAVKHVDIEAV